MRVAWHNALAVCLPATESSHVPVLIGLLHSGQICIAPETPMLNLDISIGKCEVLEC